MKKLMKKYRKSELVPFILAIYLAAMSYIGLPYYRSGEYLFYFGVLGITLVAIVLLHFILKKRERLRDKCGKGMEKKG